MEELRDAIKKGRFDFLFDSLCYESVLYLDSTEKIESSIEEGMNISLRFDNGQTALHLAAESGKPSKILF